MSIFARFTQLVSSCGGCLASHAICHFRAKSVLYFGGLHHRLVMYRSGAFRPITHVPCSIRRPSNCDDQSLSSAILPTKHFHATGAFAVILAGLLTAPFHWMEARWIVTYLLWENPSSQNTLRQKTTCFSSSYDNPAHHRPDFPFLVADYLDRQKLMVYRWPK